MIKPKRGWIERCGNIFFVLAFVPCLLMLYDSMQIGEGSDAGLWPRTQAYILASVYLGFISAVLVAVSRVWRTSHTARIPGDADP